MVKDLFQSGSGEVQNLGNVAINPITPKKKIQISFLVQKMLKIRLSINIF
jgi:hypothetical protein